MATTTPVIKKITALGYKKIAIETSDGRRYQSDLSTLSRVHCFPKNDADWARCSVDSYGLGIIWASRFEVHVDQVIGLATKVEKIADAG